MSSDLASVDTENVRPGPPATPSRPGRRRDQEVAMTVDVRPEATPAGRPRPSLRDRYTETDGLVQLTGVQALVRLPLDQHRADRAAGLRTGGYVSGYEGSPLAGYDLELGRHRDLLDAH